MAGGPTSRPQADAVEILVERELIITGIGGQGVQLAASVLAHAALAEDRAVQLFGSYGGMMRGGDTAATLVVADRAVTAPPTIGSTWSAIVMHHEHARPTIDRLREDSIAFINSSVFQGPLDRDRCRVIDIAATDMATDLGNPLVASMVMIGAYVAGTGLVGLDALVAAIPAALPPYRVNLAEDNVAAVRAGHAEITPVANAWSSEAATP
jgi:Pyruvate/2-oxoacid:ferredoxin oxidoreductase gamma subunit